MAALKGREKLDIDWNLDVKAADYDSEEAKQEFLKLARDETIKGGIVRSTGDFSKIVKKASKVLEADYVSDHVTHACIEVMNATAEPHTMGFGVDLTVPTQSQDIDMRWAARSLKTAPFMVNVHPTYAGGGFGRRVDNSCVRDAALLARKMQRPVKVLWTFEDDIRHGLYRPLTAQYLRAALDRQGNIIGWSHRIVGDSAYARMFPEKFEREKNIDRTVTDGQLHAYDIPHQHLDYVYRDKGIPIGYLRGVGGGYTVWAVESFLDVIAKEIKNDPISLRLSLLHEPRARRVSEMSGWHKKREKGVGLGIAYCGLRETPIAMVAEVKIGKGNKINVRKMWAAVDPGARSILATNAEFIRHIRFNSPHIHADIDYL